MRFYWRNRALLDKSQNRQLFLKKSFARRVARSTKMRSTREGRPRMGFTLDLLDRTMSFAPRKSRRPGINGPSGLGGTLKSQKTLTRISSTPHSHHSPRLLAARLLYQSRVPPSPTPDSTITRLANSSFLRWKWPVSFATFKIALILNQAEFHIVFVRKCVSRSNLQYCKLMQKRSLL